jgi:ubiquinone/menaquinone biosynthesis C-methylase UbiE
MAYNPETYWSDVANKIEDRREGDGNFIAGDNEPFYEYKRKKFLSLFHQINFTNNRVLEIGCGPGGNLLEVLSKKPLKLTGVDISSSMINLARKAVPNSVELIKTNGTVLPIADKQFDIVYSVTVVQHNTDEEMAKSLLAEMARVSADKVYLFEWIESIDKGDELNRGRTVKTYQNYMSTSGFELEKVEFININISYYVCGAIRKLFNKTSRLEGEPNSKLSLILQSLTLPITKVLDKLFPAKRDLGMLIFKRL